MAKDGNAPAGSAEKSDIETVLSGSNAQYLEALYARYAADPASVSADWRAFFDSENDAAPAFDGPSWARKDWPPKVNGELTAALDGDWSALEPQIKAKIEQRAAAAPAALPGGDVLQATKDSLRALMLIRAYRIRGHLIADLDPLGLQRHEVHPELDPATLGFTEADMDRPIFIDHVLGLETATLRQILAILPQ